VNLPYSRCWHCGHFLGGPERESGYSGNPKPGDFAICAYCSAPHVFRDDLTVRRPEGREWLELEKCGQSVAGREG
jgi:hypothetical protein